MAYSKDGINWTAMTSTPFTNACNTIVWTGSHWFAGGNTISSSSVVAYATDSFSWTSLQQFPISTSVTGLCINGSILVAIGITSDSGVGNTIAYSSDIYGKSWTGCGTSMFNMYSTNLVPTVKWNLNRFVAFANGNTDDVTIAYSSDGITWTEGTNTSSLFTAANSGECSTLLPHSIYFPPNYLITGNYYSADHGTSWKGLTISSSSSSETQTNSFAVAWNGDFYVFGNNTSNPSTYYSGDLNTFYSLDYLVSDPSYINVIKYNGSTWLMGGYSPSGLNTLMISYDGLNWRGVASSYLSGYVVNGIAWNGSLWVVSAYSSSSSSTSTMIYSYDGSSWVLSPTVVSSTAGGGPVEYNGSYFMAGGPHYSLDGTYISTSQNGISWTTRNIDSSLDYAAPVTSIAWNGSTWVVGVYSHLTGYTIHTTEDGYNWTSSHKISSLTTIQGAIWSGLTYSINTGSKSYYSYDGYNWSSASTTMNGYRITWTNPQIGKANIIQPIVAGGTGSYSTMAYSPDGIFYRGLGNQIFSCNCIVWNGTMYVAGGVGSDNTMAYSYDGLSWTGMGLSTFSTGCYGAKWNGTYWVAAGEGGGNTLAYSTDGTTWIGLGTIFDSCGNTVDWNGNTWLAGGKGSNTLYYNTNTNPGSSSNWIGLGNSVFTTQCNSVIWCMNKWVATGIGGNTLAYTTDYKGSSSWASCAPAGLFSSQGNTVFWNGRIVLAGGYGGNTMAYSNDAMTWTSMGSNVFTTSCNQITWNTKRWIAAGTGGNVVAYSNNGTTWYSTPTNTSNILSAGYCLGTNPKVGSVYINSALYLNQNDRFVINSPSYYDDSLSPDTNISFNYIIPS
jgi:hypothetical protein